MNKPVPTYPLTNLSNQQEDELDVFLLDTKVDRPRSAVNVPFRSNYYGVGICVSGTAVLKANLETYTVKPDDLVMLSPQIIRQFVYRSDNYRTLSIFFTQDFITTGNSIRLDSFPFFEPIANHAFKVDKEQIQPLQTSFQFIKDQYERAHPYRNEMLKNAINVVLYDIAGLYNQQYGQLTRHQTRNQVLTTAFKKLMNTHFLAQRGVTFYAQNLSVTPKHLSETVKDVTGQTAGEWIADRVILEAKVLLQHPGLSVAQIADLLHFPDQSTFGKFFKTNTSTSPKAYRASV